MPYEVRIPVLGTDIESVSIVEWHRSIGDRVKRGDALADMETDKATVELEAPGDGTLAKIVVAAGPDALQTGVVVAVIVAAGESTDEIGDYAATGSPHDEQAPAANAVADFDFDIVIVGSGPGGYVAAIRAAQLGMRTAVIEREDLGGICLNWGCIPTKTLLRSAEIYDFMKHADDFGLSVENISFDLDKIVGRSRAVAGKLNGGVNHLLKKNKVVVYNGSAKLEGGHRLSVELNDGETDTLTGRNIILATGARPREIPGIEPDGELIWTYRQAMTPDKLPESLLIVGAGAIGIEFASFYNSLGVDVTIVEMLPRILPAEDAEIAQLATNAFSKQGITIQTNARVLEAIQGADHVNVELEVDGKKTKHKFNRIISAVGVVGNHENLGLENTDVVVEGPFVKVDEWSQTDEPGVFAIGDLSGAPCLAHKASHEGITCVEHIAGIGDIHPVDRSAIPGCTYSRPQVASVGLTESGASQSGRDLKIGRFPFQGNGKAIALGETEGLIKVIYDAQTGELLGAHMVGAEVTELIQGFSIARTLETTEQELIHTIFPHPTLSEMMHEATLDAFDRVIHF